MRTKVSHAASQRNVSEPIVVAVELYGGVTGYGETLPRPYVTGETVEQAIDTIEKVFAPHLVDIRVSSFAESLDATHHLPWRDAIGKPVPAARAAVELALLDAFSRHFKRPIADAAGWLSLNNFGAPGSINSVRCSGVLANRDLNKLKKKLRLFWWYGIRDFKLKVGEPNDEARLQTARRYLAGAIKHGKASLRIDANGAWSLQQAIDHLTQWRNDDIVFVEQPLAKGDEANLGELKSCVHQPLMFDESLVTIDDAEKLIAASVVDGFNIRISKCGGFLPALRLADLAMKHGITLQLGCMVGETSILSAAGRRFLELVPYVRYLESNFGRFLLTDDVVDRSLRFRYGGKLGPLDGLGWGVEVNQGRLEELATSQFQLVL